MLKFFFYYFLFFWNTVFQIAYLFCLIGLQIANSYAMKEMWVRGFQTALDNERSLVLAELTRQRVEGKLDFVTFFFFFLSLIKFVHCTDMFVLNVS